MYIANRKLKLDQLDQWNLKKQITNWKMEDTTRLFYLRTVKEEENRDTNEEEIKSEKGVKQESFNENENNTFLYVHQEKWQRELMQKYGHDLCLMDATHKTTKYALPLFFVCVKTNAGYKIVGKFVHLLYKALI